MLMQYKLFDGDDCIEFRSTSKYKVGRLYVLAVKGEAYFAKYIGGNVFFSEALLFRRALVCFGLACGVVTLLAAQADGPWTWNTTFAMFGVGGMALTLGYMLGSLRE